MTRLSISFLEPHNLPDIAGRKWSDIGDDLWTLFFDIGEVHSWKIHQTCCRITLEYALAENADMAIKRLHGHSFSWGAIDVYLIVMLDQALIPVCSISNWLHLLGN